MTGGLNLCSPTEIQRLLSKYGFKFSKSLGQNFLIERWVPERIASAAGLSSETGVLEIGPGIGCLTVELAARAGHVAAIELDRRLEPILRETVGDSAMFFFGDALKIDIAALVRDEFHGLRAVACANLPYNITTPAITALLEAGCFEQITLMIQREVARRICAKPGTSDYGAFTVFVNWHAEPEILFDVPPGCFMPAPKVYSSVVKLSVRQEPPVSVSDADLFRRVVRAAFAQRRKTLCNALAAAFTELSKMQLQEAIACTSLRPDVRGETLDIATFAALTDNIYTIITNYCV